MQLYNDKMKELNNFLMDGELSNATKVCDYLELLLRLLKHLDEGEKIGLSENGKGIVITPTHDEPLQSMIDSFEVAAKLENLQATRTTIARRLEVSLYDLQERLRMLVEAEKYEEAAQVRDEINIKLK